jgi:hypothetical protein
MHTEDTESSVKDRRMPLDRVLTWNALSALHGFHNRPAMHAWQFIINTVHSPLAGTHAGEGPDLQKRGSNAVVSAAALY